MGIIEKLKKARKMAGLTHSQRMRRLAKREEVAKMEVGVAEQKAKIAKLRATTAVHRKKAGGGIAGFPIRFRSPAEQKKLGYGEPFDFGLKKATPKTTVKRASPKVRVKKRKRRRR